MNDYGAYQFLAVFLVVAVLFALVPLGLARLWARKFSPQKPGAQKKRGLRVRFGIPRLDGDSV